MRLLLALLLLPASIQASPYISTIKDGVNLSQGALFTPTFTYSQAFTNVAVIYHTLKSGSIIPLKLQPYLPPESWSINLGAGYLSKTGNVSAGPGLSVNLLDSVRAYASELLKSSGKSSLQAAGQQISPGVGPLNITLGPQWVTDVIVNGTVLPFNKFRLKPFWFIGASYGF